MRKILPTLLLLLLGGGIIVLATMTIQEADPSIAGSTEPPLALSYKTFPPFDLTPGELQAAIDKQIGAFEGEMRDDVLGALVDAFEVLNAAHHDEQEALRSTENFTREVERVHAAYGLAGLSAAGEVAYARFLEHTPPQEFQSYARAEGLLDSEGAIRESSRALVHLLFRYRWMQTLQPALAVPVEALLSPYEALRLRRWQVEQSRAPLETKLLILDKVRALNLPYNADLAEGILYAQSGRLEVAIQVWEARLKSALEEDDPRLVQALRQIIKQARAASD